MDPDDCPHPAPVTLDDGRLGCQACGTVYDPPHPRTLPPGHARHLEAARAAVKKARDHKPKSI